MTELSIAQKAAYRSLIDGPVYRTERGYRREGRFHSVSTMNSLKSIGICRFDDCIKAMVLVLPIDQPRQGIWHEEMGSNTEGRAGSCPETDGTHHGSDRSARGLRLVSDRDGVQENRSGD